MKRIVVILLCVALLVALAACNGQQSMDTQPTSPTESPEEANVLKIMILGSSRSVNTFHMLYEVFKDQMPDRELVLGVMYYSGCSMSMHVNFIQQNAMVYDYYRNDSGSWEIMKGVSMDMGLEDQKWDVVFLQAGTGDLENRLNEKGRIFLKDYVDQFVPQPYELWWHSTWFNSTDPELYKAPKTAADAAKVDQLAQLTQTNEAAKAYALTDPMFAGHITSGTPMMYALKRLNVPEKDLYRDHTHLSDFGCLLVGYAWYAQFTGKAVTHIGLDRISQSNRQTQYKALGDLEITREMKQIIIDTVEYTMKNPWAIPG